LRNSKHMLNGKGYQSTDLKMFPYFFVPSIADGCSRCCWGRSL